MQRAPALFFGSFQTHSPCRAERLRAGRNWYIFYTVFEFDDPKSRANAKKHGIDFIQAQELWNDPYLIEIPAMTVDEPRYLVIGRIGAKHWSAVITYRSEGIRIISVRRSRPEEVALYEG